MTKKLPTQKEINRRVKQVHRSTATLWSKMEPAHAELRAKFKWYYKWHLFPYYNLLHWLILIGALASLFYLFLNQQKLSFQLANQKYLYPLVGHYWNNLEKSSHIVFENGSLVLEKQFPGRYYPVGLLVKKLDLGRPVRWEIISWRGSFPSGTSVQFRTKGSDIDSPEAWEKIPWSGPYLQKGSRLIHEGIPSPQHRYLSG